MYNHLFKNLIWAGTGKAGNVFIVFLINVVLSRIITKNELGLYFLSFSYVLALSVIANLGMNNAIIYVLGKKENCVSNLLLIKSLTIVFFGTIISLFIFYIIHSYYLQNRLFASYSDKLIPLVMLWLFLQSFVFYSTEVLRGFYDIKNASIMGVFLSNILAFTCFSLIFFYNFKISLLLAITIINASLIISLTCCLLIIFNKIKLHNRISTDTALELQYIMPLWTMNIFIVILTEMGIFLVSYLYGENEIAIYGVAQRMTKLILFPLYVVNSVLPPIISKNIHQEDKTTLQSEIRFLASISSLISLGLLILLFIFGDYVLQFLFGYEFREAKIPMLILSIGSIVAVWTGACGLALIYNGRSKLMAYLTGTTVILSIIFSITFHPLFGFLSIPIGITLGQITQNLIQLFLTKHLLNIWTIPDFRFLLRLKKF